MKNFACQSIAQDLSNSNLQGNVGTVGKCLIGSVFIALMAQVAIYLPFTPIPVSMQTLAVFLLIVIQGQKKATFSVLMYLAQASMGLPVLAGGVSNPAWLMTPSAGYLVGFVTCTLVGGYLIEKSKNASFLWTLFSIGCGQLTIYLMGTAYLASFVGIEKAFALGVAPFIYGAFLKAFAAACSVKPVRYIQDLVSNS